jgi:hypothetical protein
MRRLCLLILSLISVASLNALRGPVREHERRQDEWARRNADKPVVAQREDQRRVREAEERADRAERRPRRVRPFEPSGWGWRGPRGHHHEDEVRHHDHGGRVHSHGRHHGHRHPEEEVIVVEEPAPRVGFGFGVGRRRRGGNFWFGF